MITADRFVEAWAIGTVLAVIFFIVFLIGIWIYNKISP